MISIPRSILSTFRTLVRKAGLHKRSTASSPGFTVAAEGGGCFVRAASAEAAIQYRHGGSFVPARHRLPLDALDAIDGRQGDVTFHTDGKSRTLLTWTDHGVPRQASFDAPKPATFPEMPTSFATNEPMLWSALHDAVPVTDRDATRYALGCLCLRGSRGRIDATDGRHVLTQAGFEFPWTDDALLPANGLLGCKALDVGMPIGVGRSGGWIGFQVGNWLVMFAEPKEGRWPKIDDIIPKAEAAKSRLELSAHDAKFLCETLPRLPGNDDPYRPVTCDLNGRVLVRAAEPGNARPTEVCLASSKFIGEPVTIQSNRTYVEQALRLGFRTMHLYGPDKPVLCEADNRCYLWMLLDKDLAVKPAKDAVDIDSSTAAAPAIGRPEPNKEATMTTSLNNQVPASATAVKPHDAAKRTGPRPTASVLDQAIAIRDSLRRAARQAGDLAKLLRHQKRQSRLVESTLASLKELQKVAG